MSLGMAMTVAPLTTTVMNAVPKSKAGVASGINNAVSRLASLIAIAAFGALLVTVFVHTLDRQLASLSLPSDVLAQIQENRLELAAIHIRDEGAAHAIAASFVHAYRSVLWVATASLLLAACFGCFVMASGRVQAADQE